MPADTDVDMSYVEEAEHRNENIENHSLIAEISLLSDDEEPEIGKILKKYLSLKNLQNLNIKIIF